VRVGDVVDELRRHERLHQPDEGHAQGVGGDDLQRLEREGDVGQHEERQAVGQVTLAADVRQVPADGDRERRQHDDRHERRRDGGGQPGQQEDDRQAGGGHGVDQPRHADQLR
jgi:hypothetical protein